MKNHKVLTGISLGVVHALFAALLFLLFALPNIVDWYISLQNRSVNLAAVVMLTFYPCLPFGFYSLTSCRNLLKRFLKGDILTKKNVSSLTHIFYSLAAIALITLVAGFFYMPFFIAAGATLVSLLPISLIKIFILNLMPAEVKEEPDEEIKEETEKENQEENMEETE